MNDNRNLAPRRATNSIVTAGGPIGPGFDGRRGIAAQALSDEAEAGWLIEESQPR
ncbi:hypothetical protein ABZT49_26010 [Methylobacterium sp. EM32]|uniref:hypothetical protein n=1 Tax=Methylobacterium sp. EM32 TaxID=3163481 RepID=UPI0033AE613D